MLLVLEKPEPFLLTEDSLHLIQSGNERVLWAVIIFPLFKYGPGYWLHCLWCSGYHCWCNCGSSPEAVVNRLECTEAARSHDDGSAWEVLLGMVMGFLDVWTNLKTCQLFASAALTVFVADFQSFVCVIKLWELFSKKKSTVADFKLNLVNTASAWTTMKWLEPISFLVLGNTSWMLQHIIP